MPNLLQSAVKRLAGWLARRLPSAEAEHLAYQIVSRKNAELPALESLHMLLRLDEKFYRLQGKTAVEYGDGLHPKYRLTRYRDFFVSRIRKGEKVLDVGCSFGAVAFDIAERSGATVLGIDIDTAFIEKAQQLYRHPRVQYKVGDALKTLPEGPFNVVILSNVLEHLPDRPDFLRRIVQTAQPRRILLRVPVYERDWRVPLKKELGIEWRLDPTHETEYTLESFKEEMRQAGLTISYQEVRWGEIWAVATPASANRGRRKRSRQPVRK